MGPICSGSKRREEDMAFTGEGERELLYVGLVGMAAICLADGPTRTGCTRWFISLDA